MVFLVLLLRLNHTELCFCFINCTLYYLTWESTIGLKSRFSGAEDKQDDQIDSNLAYYESPDLSSSIRVNRY